MTRPNGTCAAISFNLIHSCSLLRSTESYTFPNDARFKSEASQSIVQRTTK